MSAYTQTERPVQLVSPSAPGAGPGPAQMHPQARFGQQLETILGAYQQMEGALANERLNYYKIKEELTLLRARCGEAESRVAGLASREANLQAELKRREASETSMQAQLVQVKTELERDRKRAEQEVVNLRGLYEKARNQASILEKQIAEIKGRSQQLHLQLQVETAAKSELEKRHDLEIRALNGSTEESKVKAERLEERARVLEEQASKSEARAKQESETLSQSLRAARRGYDEIKARFEDLSGRLKKETMEKEMVLSFMRGMETRGAEVAREVQALRHQKALIMAANKKLQEELAELQAESGLAVKKHEERLAQVTAQVSAKLKELESQPVEVKVELPTSGTLPPIQIIHETTSESTPAQAPTKAAARFVPMPPAAKSSAENVASRPQPHRSRYSVQDLLKTKETQLNSAREVLAIIRTKEPRSPHKKKIESYIELLCEQQDQLRGLLGMKPLNQGDVPSLAVKKSDDRVELSGGLKPKDDAEVLSEAEAEASSGQVQMNTAVGSPAPETADAAPPVKVAKMVVPPPPPIPRLVPQAVELNSLDSFLGEAGLDFECVKLLDID